MQKVILSDHYAEHETGEGHPESPERYQKLRNYLENTALGFDVSFVSAQKGNEEQILLAHGPEYLKTVKSTIPETGTAKLDEDTVVSKGSFETTLYGVGGVCQAVDMVMQSESPEHMIVASRPPGHHACVDKSMGFCVFSNIAIGAAHAVNKHALERVAIIDIDVHHGNGTQDVVLKRLPNVTFASLQEGGIWPYNDKDQISNDQVLNIALKTQCPAEEWMEEFKTKALPFIEKSNPQLILVSAGFDAHKYDPPEDILFNDAPGRQNLVDSDYQQIASLINQLAQRICNGRVVSVLEGGYNTDNVPKAFAAYISGYEN